MGDSIEQYRGAVGSHFVFLKFMEYKKMFQKSILVYNGFSFLYGNYLLASFKGCCSQLWCHAYESSMADTNVALSVLHPWFNMSSKWCRWKPRAYFFKNRSQQTEDGLRRKLDIKNQSNVLKKSKFTEINASVNAVKNARFIYDNILANENCWSNVNTFLFVPCNAKEQSLCCSLLNLPSVVKPCSVSRIPQQLGKPTKLCKTQGDGNRLFRAIHI